MGWRRGVDNTLVFPVEGPRAVCRIVDGSLITVSKAEELMFTCAEFGFMEAEWSMQCGDVEPIRLLWSAGSTVQLP